MATSPTGSLTCRRQSAATTKEQWVPSLVAVEPDAIYVHDNDVWTSAGVTAGIDLALALVADDHGARAAGEVARQLVVYLRRSGGQAQFSAVLAAQSSDHEPVRDVLTWLTDNLTADLSIPALAAQATLLGAQKRGPFAL
jgi:transcriptional regulator GlxA family with amidase domain